MNTLNLLTSVFLLTLGSLNWFQLSEAGSSNAWLLERNDQLERESLTNLPPASPVQVGAARYASQIYNGRPLASIHHQQQQHRLEQSSASDLFQCVEPSRSIFQNFVETYNRTFDDDSEELERKGLFMNTLKRTILLNRIVQNEILNQSNYDIKPSIGNYHFISPLGSRNVALWYADITDCELGLVKYIMFNIIYHIDNNDLAEAYKVALDNSRYLPLLNADGFEQLANILLVRLFDRFQGDNQMDQLFQWPLYLKKLVGYAYNRRQAEQPDFEDKLALISYAYPAYFKDLKYNPLAVNRTGDNIKAHQDHERFNKFHQRRFLNNRERNKRLAIFRQRWTLVNQLNGVYKRDWQNVTTKPEWLRVNTWPTYDIATTNNGQSEKLRAEDGGEENYSNQGSDQLGLQDGRFKHTIFSDLTDAEFVAYLTNDFSLLENSKESADYIDTNFPIRYLSESYKNELAFELELRRALKASSTNTQQQQVDSQNPMQRPNFQLARRVIDELINDVGLPIGATAIGNSIPESEYYNVFIKIGRAFGKSYAQNLNSGDKLPPEQADEHQRRYDQFKVNYARFKAWFIKEGWTAMDETRMVAMLRLADMSWYEIKLTLFKICCLTDENLIALEATNATIQYLGTNQFLCQPLSRDAVREQTQVNQAAGNSNNNNNNVDPQARDLAALELYYYYTVHFNKHHTDMDTFNKRFAIFRNNIEQIRKHSCTRGLTIYGSLQKKIADTLSSIDPLDARRSYTDDINLDRYRYFTVPNLDLSPDQQQKSLDELNPDEGFEKLRIAPQNSGTQTSARLASNETPSRAGISYRRSSFFSSLLENPDQRVGQTININNRPGISYADKLMNTAQNFNLQALKYRQNSAYRIYELVMQRYRYCMRAVRKIEVDERRQNCQASGPLAEQSDSWLAMRGNQLNSAERLELKQQDQCAFYRMGLEAWDEGLIKQSSMSIQLISGAKCYSS